MRPRVEALETRALLSGMITGTVYPDYNGNDIQDTLEPGIGGVQVTAYDATNTAIATTTTMMPSLERALRYRSTASPISPT